MVNGLLLVRVIQIAASEHGPWSMRAVAAGSGKVTVTGF
jgi:hypothetical protein